MRLPSGSERSNRAIPDGIAFEDRTGNYIQLSPMELPMKIEQAPIK